MTFEYPYDDWAEIYDEVYSELLHDVPFYVQQATKSGGPVLELGCGTGRISLAIASSGIRTVGVDISPKMIAVAKGKAEQSGLGDSCIFQTGDMASTHIAERFGAVLFPFRSFQSMASGEEQFAALDTAARHLSPGGRLILDIFNPDLRQLANEHDEAVPFHVQDVKLPDGSTIVVWGQNSWDPTTQLNEARLILEWLDPQGNVTRRIYREFQLRYTFRFEMEHLLARAGFEPELVAGDFSGGPVTEESDDLVWVARKL